MKKALSYIIPLIAAVLACMPHIPARITAQGPLWPWLITCLGFAGVYTLFIRTTFVIRAVAVLGFIWCFFSHAPYVSFNAYFLILLSCYFYIGAVRMDSWKPAFKILKSLLILHSIFLAVQLAGYDKLLNFGLQSTEHYGVIGSHMQEASFMVVLAALLIQTHPLFLVFPFVAAFICNSTWSIFCVAVGVWFCSSSRKFKGWAVAGVLVFILMGVLTHKFQANVSPGNRLDVWVRTVKMTAEHPWTGWGPGTFKFIFPAMNRDMNTLFWKSAHNDWLQFLFEVGYPAFFLLIFIVSSVFSRIKLPNDKHAERCLKAGFMMIVCNMLVHFPTRTFQIFPLILLFLAYCETTLRYQYRLIK